MEVILNEFRNVLGARWGNGGQTAEADFEGRKTIPKKSETISGWVENEGKTAEADFEGSKNECQTHGRVTTLMDLYRYMYRNTKKYIERHKMISSNDNFQMEQKYHSAGLFFLQFA